MTLKSAGFLALIGMILATLLLTVHLIRDLMGVVEGIVPPLALVSSFIYAFAGITVTLFVFMLQRERR